LTIKCPQCQTNNPDNLKFCGECGTKLPSPQEIAVTKTIESTKEELSRGEILANRYEIIEELGRGGMGQVYRVEDKKLNQEIALKLINPEIAQDKKTIERFRNELRTARMISHKNVCRMFDLGEAEGVHFITMEFIRGEDLKSFIHRSGQLAVKTAVRIARQVCEGLAEARLLGVVHRDLKPSNIMIDREGNARIMDFGIALSLESKGITGAGLMIGTPEYMSPEQAEGKEVDQRSDIYSLGVILYETVTGRLPFEGDTPLRIALKHKHETPKDPRELNPQIPDDLSRLILKCMAKKKENRYQSAEEVCAELTKLEKKITTTEKIMLKRKLKTVKMGRIRWKNIILYGGATVLLILLIIMGRNTFFTGQGSQFTSIAVLPLANLSGDPSQEYFSDGMTDALIANLGKIGALRVISRQSVMRYKGSNKSLPEIARELKVDIVLEGTVVRSGKRVRITAQLIEGATDRHLWVKSYERDLEDVLILQAEVARAIAHEIKVKLTSEEEARLASLRLINPEAQEFFLRGRYYYNQITSEGIKKASEYFQKAIEADPDYALAYAALADCYGWFGYEGSLPQEEAYSKTIEFSKKALEIDDTLAEAHQSLAAWMFYYKWNWKEAEKKFKRALALNSSLVGNNEYAWLLIALGRHEEAIAEAKRTLRLDPFTTSTNQTLAYAYYYARRYEEALSQWQHFLELRLNEVRAYEKLAATSMVMGNHKNFVKYWKKASLLSGVSPEEVEALGLTFSQSGPKGYWQWRLERFEGGYDQSPYQVAIIYAQLGEKEKAFLWLEKAFQEHEMTMFTIKVNPLCDPLRPDPRFKDLLRRMNFPE